MAQDATKDFFISYNKVDRAWADWMGWQSEGEGREWGTRILRGAYHLFRVEGMDGIPLGQHPESLESCHVQ